MTTYVYKYSHPDYEWLYVGKADNSIKERIYEHSREAKFQPFLKDIEIYFIELENKAQSKFIEAYLIDKHKPCLNIKDKYEGNSSFILNLPEWKLYNEFDHKEPQRSLTTNNRNDSLIAEYVTIKKFCEMVDKSPQSIYKRLKKEGNPIIKFVKLINGNMMISTKALCLYQEQEQFIKNEQMQIDALVNKDLVDMLYKEIEEKNEQLKAKDRQIENLMNLLIKE